jgi:hypothetical protein
MSQDDDFEILACEYDKRPKDAPSFFDVAGALRGVRREGGTLIVSYDTAAAPDIARLVAAEQQCCPGIGWELATGPAVEVRIHAAPAQLDVFEQFLTA